uniref:ATP synthase subunit a n=2 Tax=Berytidae TaxID=236388 RepID=B7SMP8_9HEMI|nr:ATP synthase F0 subunit 6 [Yemmalysus parallelus]ABZ02142.1 ATP synthase F0 subunit 6 [Yemmalysus parallelus]UPL65498.1 ATPase subunit 6 [Metatropis brevirostris]
MLTNLFSTFDPSTSLSFSFNWISSITCFLLMPMSYWFLPNRINIMINSVMKKLHEEFKMLMGINSKGMTLMMTSLFMFILINNIMGLLPYIFTSSSHLVFTLTLALPMWLSLMLFGWINHTNHMFSHLIPVGTPTLLMPFMVMIETISNIIRPGSLAVRLTANMIAGHLLMSLLGNNAANGGIALTLIILVQIMLMMFESAVALIQAYVFSVLSTLYSSEIM